MSTIPSPKTTSIVIGAYVEHICPQLVEVLLETGTKTAMSLYGIGDSHEEKLGIDEISICGTTRVVELRQGKIERYSLRPEDFVVKRCSYKDVASKGSALGNALTVMRVLAVKDDGPVADLYAVNAAVALRVAGMEDDLKKATSQAREVLASGAALDKLKKLIEYQGGETGLAQRNGLLGEIEK
jgi:anthranilate phosphoribosyltransferase